MTWNGLFASTFTSDTSVTWLPPWEWHNPHVSWQLIFLQIETTWPIYGYVQSPDFTAVTSSPPWQFITLSARLLCYVFLMYTIADFKAPTATSKCQQATSSGVWDFFVSNCPNADNIYSKGSSFTLLYKGCKMHTFVSKRDTRHTYNGQHGVSINLSKMDLPSVWCCGHERPLFCL